MDKPISGFQGNNIVFELLQYMLLFPLHKVAIIEVDI